MEIKDLNNVKIVIHLALAVTALHPVNALAVIIHCTIIKVSAAIAADLDTLE